MGETKTSLLDAGCQLFSEHGFHGTSVRAITGLADANLGAVTYHFGSKRELYEAVLEHVLAPFRECVRTAAEADGAPLDRIDALIRTVLDYFAEHPELRKLALREMVTGDAVPEPIRRTFRANLGRLIGLIEAGQRDGSIRAGDPRLLALAVGAQPFLLNVMRPLLEQAAAIDLQHPADREPLVGNAIQFVRAGLEANGHRR